MNIPDVFCWTRFGTEAGQPIDDILYRKEQERAANLGMFLWGIGNSIGPSLLELIGLCEAPSVLFSPTKSSPRSVDERPALVAAWTRAETIDGLNFPLPTQSLVTSQYDAAGRKSAHYALVCFSNEALVLRSGGLEIDFAALTNLVSGNRLGASQVTSVVRLNRKNPPSGRNYRVALQARLVYPFFVRLSDPVALKRPATDVRWAEAVRSEWADRSLSHRRLS